MHVDYKFLHIKYLWLLLLKNCTITIVNNFMSILHHISTSHSIHKVVGVKSKSIIQVWRYASIILKYSSTENTIWKVPYCAFRKLLGRIIRHLLIPSPIIFTLQAETIFWRNLQYFKMFGLIIISISIYFL